MNANGAILLDSKTGKPESERGSLRPVLDARAREDARWERVIVNLDKAETSAKELGPNELRAMTRNKSYFGGRPASATAATARVATVNIWNPAAAARIFLYEVWICGTAAVVSNVALARSTARGTASTTITPGSDNAIERDVAPPSGVVLDLAWSVAPTIAAGDLVRWNLPATIGAGVILVFPDPVTIPAGTGIAVITPVAVAFQVCDFTIAIGD